MDGPDWPVETREAMARLAGALYAIVRGGWTTSRFQSDRVYLTTAKRDETRVTHAWLAASLGNSQPAEELAREYELLEERLRRAFSLKGEREAARKAWVRGVDADWVRGA